MNNTLSHNVADDNGVLGILLQNASGNTLAFNSANGTMGGSLQQQYGIYLNQSSNYNNLTDNSAFYNNRTGSLSRIPIIIT